MTHHLPGPMPGPPGVPPPPAMPEDVRTARQLWWGVALVGIVQLIASILAATGQQTDLPEQVLEQMRKSDPAATLEQAERMTSVMLIIGGAVVGLGLAALTVLLAHLMARGKFWARAILTVVGIWTVCTALVNLFALGSITGPAIVVAGGASIVQGVIAGGAVFLMHRKDSTAYFLANRRR
ncbi:hypothetical protein [Nocardia sp. NPDC048505]|uniref:hypothetical protein n=1 Tax=unclassified Nocardia TaxID=2637762 RepID=UPI0033D7BACB